MDEIEEICIKYGIKKYTINKDLNIDVKGGVDLYNKELDKLPLKFNRVNGYFYCSNNKLTSLAGCPQYIGGNFFCCDNQLTSLEECPQIIGGDFFCFDNKLTTLEGSPLIVGGDFVCNYNQLTILKGCPQIIGGGFKCYGNPLKSLKGFPQSVGNRVYIDGKYGNFKYQDGVIDKIYEFFGNYDLFYKSLFYNWFEDGKIIDFKLNRAIKEVLGYKKYLEWKEKK